MRNLILGIILGGFTSSWWIRTSVLDVVVCPKESGGHICKGTEDCIAKHRIVRGRLVNRRKF